MPEFEFARMILFVAADRLYRSNLERIGAWWNRLRGRPASPAGVEKESA